MGKFVKISLKSNFTLSTSFVLFFSNANIFEGKWTRSKIHDNFLFLSLFPLSLVSVCRLKGITEREKYTNSGGESFVNCDVKRLQLKIIKYNAAIHEYSPMYNEIEMQNKDTYARISVRQIKSFEIETFFFSLHSNCQDWWHKRSRRMLMQTVKHPNRFKSENPLRRNFFLHQTILP